jgi:hypothetical protein
MMALHARNAERIMTALAASLVTASAAIVALLGTAHLLYTFHGSKLSPRDPELQTRMQQTSLRITRQTTMWKAWIGFNASHGCGLLLFGAVYGYLALTQADLLFRSVFLGGLGLLSLFAYAVLAKQYFFRAPFRAVVLATFFCTLAFIVRTYGGE